MVIGSRKKVSKLERDALLFSRPFSREDSNCRQNGRGCPVHTHSRPVVVLSQKVHLHLVLSDLYLNSLELG